MTYQNARDELQIFLDHYVPLPNLLNNVVQEWTQDIFMTDLNSRDSVREMSFDMRDWVGFKVLDRTLDYYTVGAGSYTLGSDAADTLPFGDESFTVDARNGANSINGGSGNNFVKTGIGADTINLTSGNNVIISEAGANVINVTSGHNFISTGLGADSITATGGNNVIDAGDGANTITVTDGDNIIITGNGADNITTAGIATTYANGNVWTQGTVNTINAGDGANTITTGAGDDHITGGINADTITSGAGNDIVFAGRGANTITTGDGDDVIHTGVDVDTVAAGLGDDRIHVYGGTDTIAAGAGNDTLIVHFEGAAGAVSINSLSGNVDIGYSGNVSGFGAATFLGVENFHISSGAANDIITTGDGADVVHAGGGSDIVNLGGGDDEAIYTMAANYNESDVYQGGDGVDTLTLEFTTEEWNQGQFVQEDITRYQAHLADPNSGSFAFTAFDLTVSEFEHLSVRIGDGDATDMTVAPVEVNVIDLTYGGTGWYSKTGYFAEHWYYKNASTVGSDGNDEITVGTNAGSRRGSVTVDGGDGDDEISFGDYSGRGGATATVIGGNGDDTISFGAYAGTLNGTVSADGGAGADTFEFGDNAHNLTIDLGAGDGDRDRVTFEGSVYNATINNWEVGDKVSVLDKAEWSGLDDETDTTFTNGSQDITFLEVTDVDFNAFFI
jgi:Ca2+-binding RTX toxin-like protein